MSNVNLYASREGALYQSYDNFAGVQGFYDPSQEAPAQPVSTGTAAMMASSLALVPVLALVVHPRSQGLWRNRQ
jgi:hypothetical protein